MLIRGGENIYCTEIEDRLTAHADVVEAAVFGIPDRVLGEVVGAAVFLRPGSAADFRTLADHVGRSEEHTSELQSLMRISYAVFCLKKKQTRTPRTTSSQQENPRSSSTQ